jgi:hypothetical protein
LLVGIVALLAKRVERASPEQARVTFMSVDVIAYGSRTIDASALAHCTRWLCP